MINDPKVLSLLELLAENKLPALEPVFAPRPDGWVSYPVVENHLGVDAEYAQRLLSDLHRLGYLERHFAERLLFCPVCNSHNLEWSISCPKCGSPNLTRVRLLRHRPCNWTAPEKDFQRKDERICPKCRAELFLVGSDYDDLGNRYQCENCREITRAPVEKWHCPGCNRIFPKDGVREMVLYRFVLDPAQISKLRLERIPRAKVLEILKREGYDVQESARLVGKSGAEHTIDILATKHTGPLEHKVVVGLASAERAVDSEEVIKLYAKAYDVGAQDIILIAVPCLSEDAQQFAQHYHIRVYNAEALDRLLAGAGHII